MTNVFQSHIAQVTAGLVIWTITAKIAHVKRKGIMILLPSLTKREELRGNLECVKVKKIIDNLGILKKIIR